MSKYQDALLTLVTNSSQLLKENKLEGSQFMEWHNKSRDLLQELVDKEAEYQAFEEKFGIKLLTLLKADKVYLIYSLEDGELKESYRVHFDITRNKLVIYEDEYDDLGFSLYFENYKKTWWLKEDLANGETYNIQFRN